MRVRQGGLPRLAEKDHAVELDHHIRGQSGGQRQRRRAQRDEHVDERMGNLRREEKRLQQQPLGNEAVERRQARDGERADQGQRRHPRHAADQAAELAQAALFGRMQHRAGGQKQQALEERVVERVDQRGAEGERRKQAQVAGLEQNGQADAGKDDSDVLDRGVRQQALHVGLHAAKIAPNRAENRPSASTALPTARSGRAADRR